MITLTNRQLHDAIKPVRPLTSADWALPMLQSVLLSVRNGYLYTAATDRFRAGIQRIQLNADFPQAETFEAIVNVYDLSRLLTLFKPGRASVIKQPKLRLSTEDGVLYAEAIAGSTMDDSHDFKTLRIGMPLVTGQFPDIFKVVLEAVESSQEPVDAQGFTAEFLASFQEAAKVAGNGRTEPLVIRLGTAASQPAAVRIGDSFIGVIMPRRSHDGEPLAVTARGWSDELKSLSSSTSVKAVAR